MDEGHPRRGEAAPEGPGAEGGPAGTIGSNSSDWMVISVATLRIEPHGRGDKGTEGIKLGLVACAPRRRNRLAPRCAPPSISTATVIRLIAPWARESLPAGSRKISKLVSVSLFLGIAARGGARRSLPVTIRQVRCDRHRTATGVVGACARFGLLGGDRHPAVGIDPPLDDLFGFRLGFEADFGQRRCRSPPAPRGAARPGVSAPPPGRPNLRLAASPRLVGRDDAAVGVDDGDILGTETGDGRGNEKFQGLGVTRPPATRWPRSP